MTSMFELTNKTTAAGVSTKSCTRTMPSELQNYICPNVTKRHRNTHINQQLWDWFEMT